MALLTKYLQSKREKVIKPFINGSVLDIGCGQASILKMPEINEYYGVELNKEVILKLSQRFPQHTFIVSNLENGRIKLKNKVDAVIMLAFLEHLSNYENAVNQGLNNLKENGVMVITTPSKFGHKIHNIGSFIGLFSKEARQDHKTILSKKDFIKIAEKYNLKLIKFQYFELFCNQLVVYGR